ncbi:MAG: outer membrane protein transport protein [Pseudomonadota bacterium]
MRITKLHKNNILLASVLSALGLGVSNTAFAVNGFQLIGFGKDQVAVGGAVTANPSSAMTALTNPAGLTMVGERADFTLEAFMPDVRMDATESVFTGGAGNPGQKAKSSGDFYGIPSIGWVAATSDPKLFFGGGMYATAGLGADYGTVNLNTVGNPVTGAPTTFNGYSNVTMFRVSPALGYKVSPTLSVGAALNINMLQLGFRETIAGTFHPVFGAGAFDTNFNLGRAGQSFGVGGTVGVVFDAVPDLVRLGASYTTKANFQDTEFRLAEGDINNPGLLNGPMGAAPAGTYKAAFDFPQQAAVGVAFMPTGPLTISADVKWINYKDTLRDFYVTGPNGTYNLQPGWDDVWVYAIGATYRSGPLKLMAGYNYSDAPIGDQNTFANLIFPAIVKHHISAGFNYALGKNWDVGAAFRYVPRETIQGKGDLPPAAQAAGFGTDSNIKLDNQITAMSFNIGYRF